MSEVPQHNVKQGTAGQRRHLTILFSDLSDSTRLSGQMDQEDYAELLEALRKLFRKIIPAHGGQIVSIQGDGVLAIFGYPEVRENDARRATEAALDLHAAVRALEVPAVAGPAGPLELHSGIHAGLVYLSPGDVELGRFALGGEVSNTAARLSADAGRGEIYISAETLGPDVQFFSVGERSVRSLKGRAAPLAVFRILGRAPAQSRFRGRSAQRLTPFVGRDGSSRRCARRLAPRPAAGRAAFSSPAIPGSARRASSRSSCATNARRPSGSCAATARATSPPSPCSRSCRCCARSAACSRACRRPRPRPAPKARSPRSRWPTRRPGAR